MFKKYYRLKGTHESNKEWVGALAGMICSVRSIGKEKKGSNCVEHEVRGLNHGHFEKERALAIGEGR